MTPSHCVLKKTSAKLNLSERNRVEKEELRKVSFALQIAQQDIPLDDEYSVMLMMEYFIKYTTINLPKKRY
jgi:hypothetical protein